MRGVAWCTLTEAVTIPGLHGAIVRHLVLEPAAEEWTHDRKVATYDSHAEFGVSECSRKDLRISSVSQVEFWQENYTDEGNDASAR